MKPNRKELVTVCGVAFDPSAPDFLDQVVRYTRKLLRTCDIARAVVTLSEKGMVYVPRDDGETVYLPTEGREVCDVSGAPITGDAFFCAAEGGALSPAAAAEIAAKRPYPESLRRLLSTLSVIDWASPPVFTAKRSDIEAGESLLVSYLQETFGHGLRSLKFIRQLGA